MKSQSYLSNNYIICFNGEHFASHYTFNLEISTIPIIKFLYHNKKKQEA